MTRRLGASHEVGLVALAQQRRPIRLAALILASAVFFALLGPPVGSIIFFADLGPLAAVMFSYTIGFGPALLTGILNAVAVIVGVIPHRSPRGRLLHALIGGACGFLATVLVIDYPDWYLLTRTSDWYDVWYTFNRAYAQFSLAGALAGAVCSFLFNPWGQRLWQPSPAIAANARVDT